MLCSTTKTVTLILTDQDVRYLRQVLGEEKVPKDVETLLSRQSFTLTPDSARRLKEAVQNEREEWSAEMKAFSLQLFHTLPSFDWLSAR